MSGNKLKYQKTQHFPSMGPSAVAHCRQQTTCRVMVLSDMLPASSGVCVPHLNCWIRALENSSHAKINLFSKCVDKVKNLILTNADESFATDHSRSLLCMCWRTWGLENWRFGQQLHLEDQII